MSRHGYVVSTTRHASCALGAIRTLRRPRWSSSGERAARERRRDDAAGLGAHVERAGRNAARAHQPARRPSGRCAACRCRRSRRRRARSVSSNVTCCGGASAGQAAQRPQRAAHRAPRRRRSTPELIQNSLAVRREAHVVREVVGGERAQEARAPRARDVDEREPRRLRAERGDDARAVGRDRDVARALPHLDAADHARPRHVDRDHLARGVVAHVGVRAARRIAGRVARALRSPRARAAPSARSRRAP